MPNSAIAELGAAPGHTEEILGLRSPDKLHQAAAAGRRKDPLDGDSKSESDFRWTKRVTLQAIRKDEARRAPSRRDMRSARWLRIALFAALPRYVVH